MANKLYINYADKSFEKQQNYALKKARKRGGFNQVIGYTRNDIDDVFYNKNKTILNKKRGGGYWLWKPYFIYKTLEKIEMGDYLFYSDSGAFFIKSVDYLIEELNINKQDIMGYELPLIESQWTKQELFLNINCEEIHFKESNQIMATYILIKKSKFAVNFFNKYLLYACNEANITDNTDEKISRISDFIDHRHDQSIFSLLYKKYNLKPFREPSQFGVRPVMYANPKWWKGKLPLCESSILEFDEIYEFPSKYLLYNQNKNIQIKYRCHKYRENYGIVLFSNRKDLPIFALLKYTIKVVLYNIFKIINR